MDRAALEALDRDSLVAHAEAQGVSRARILTRPELVDELLLREAGGDRERAKKARGWLGRARDLVARVIERGLHLPDAADRLRGEGPPPPARRAPSALPTVTLAEIYATQGHKQKALDTLRQVLATEPEHAAAQALMNKLQDASFAVPEAPVMPPEDDELGGSSDLGPDVEGPREPQEPARMLDSEAVPAGYDVDECVTMSVDPSTAYVYWEVRADTLARLHAGQGQGRLFLRILVIVPTWDGPRTATRDLDVQGAALGDWFVRELPKDAIVRAAIGWLLPDGVFVSAAHSFPVEPAPADRSPFIADLLSRWTAEGTVAAGTLDAEAMLVARAVARSEARRIAEERARLGEDAWIEGQGGEEATVAGFAFRHLGSSERSSGRLAARRPLGSSDRMGSSWS